MWRVIKARRQRFAGDLSSGTVIGRSVAMSKSTPMGSPAPSRGATRMVLGWQVRRPLRAWKQLPCPVDGTEATRTQGACMDW